MNVSNSLSVFSPRISFFSPFFCFFVVLSSRCRYFYFSLYLKFNRSFFYRYAFVLKRLFVFSFSSPLRFICFLFVCFLLSSFKAIFAFIFTLSLTVFLFFRGWL